MAWALLLYGLLGTWSSLLIVQSKPTFFCGFMGSHFNGLLTYKLHDMKNVVFLCLAILVVGCSTKEDDYSNKTQQEVWINGYTTTSSSEYADKQTNIIRFLFFDPDKASTFDGKTFNTGFDSYYQYTKLQEDPIYTMLIDESRLLLKDGSTISPIYEVESFKDETKEITLPVGKYFVVAFYYERGYRRDFWNKYTTQMYELKSRYNPQTLTVVIPINYTQYGRIDWRNWEN